MGTNHLDRFRHFSTYSDPGGYAFLYEGLPTTPEGISQIIHTQLIHPAAARATGIKLTNEQERDELNLLTVTEILTKLQQRRPTGLSTDRKPDQRVVTNCRGHALIMASVLKSQGVPARLRCGFAPYLMDGFSCDHTVLEAWIDERWRLMDADATNEYVRDRGYNFDVYDMPPEMFNLAGEAWLRARQRLDPAERYGIPDGRRGWPFLHTALIRDMLALFGQEVAVWTRPQFKSMPDEEVQPTLDRIAELTAKPDQNWDELKQLYRMIDVPTKPR